MAIEYLAPLLEGTERRVPLGNGDVFVPHVVHAHLRWRSAPVDSTGLVESGSPQRAALRAWRLNGQEYSPELTAGDWPTGLAEEGPWDELAGHIQRARLHHLEGPTHNKSLDLAIQELLEERDDVSDRAFEP